jgi:hypothetical protein
MAAKSLWLVAGSLVAAIVVYRLLKSAGSRYA